MKQRKHVGEKMFWIIATSIALAVVGYIVYGIVWGVDVAEAQWVTKGLLMAGGIMFIAIAVEAGLSRLDHAMELEKE